MIFKKKPTNMRLCNENKVKLENLFYSKVSITENYELVYGTSLMMKNLDKQLMDSDSQIAHLVIGFRESDVSFVLLQTDYMMSKCGDPLFYSWNNLKNAKIVGGQFTLYHDDSVISGITKISVLGFLCEKGVIYMNQIEEASKWDSFWIRFLTSRCINE